MLEQKIKNLSKSMEEKKCEAVVKYFFLDYKETYHTLRNPTKEQTDEYLALYLKYMQYCSGIKKEM